jgi:hypothetical protein
MMNCLWCGNAFDETCGKSGKKSPKTRLCCSRPCVRAYHHTQIYKPRIGTCRYCGITLPSGHFKVCSAKECQLHMKAEYRSRYYNKHPDRYQQMLKRRVQQHQENPEHKNELNRNHALNLKLSVLAIIGSSCIASDCQTFGRVPEIDHIAEEGYWSGREHRARVGASSEVCRDLLRLHKQGIDITKIVQPLCKICNLKKHWAHRHSKLAAQEAPHDMEVGA